MMYLFNTIEIIIWAILGVPLTPLIASPPLVNPDALVSNCFLYRYQPPVGSVDTRPRHRRIMVRMKPDEYDQLFGPNCKRGYLLSLETSNTSVEFVARRAQ